MFAAFLLPTGAEKLCMRCKISEPPIVRRGGLGWLCADPAASPLLARIWPAGHWAGDRAGHMKRLPPFCRKNPPLDRRCCVCFLEQAAATCTMIISKSAPLQRCPSGPASSLWTPRRPPRLSHAAAPRLRLQSTRGNSYTASAGSGSGSTLGGVLVLPGFLFSSRQYASLVADLKARGYDAGEQR